jgi:hypothetical protein
VVLLGFWVRGGVVMLKHLPCLGVAFFVEQADNGVPDREGQEEHPAAAA